MQLTLREQNVLITLVSRPGNVDAPRLAHALNGAVIAELLFLRSINIVENVENSNLRWKSRG